MSNDDIESLIAAGTAQLHELEAIYQTTLDQKEVSGHLRVVIKNMLENYRSALDYLAVKITNTYGKPVPGTRIYYPLAQAESAFNSQIDLKMPGARDNRPDIADVIKRHQPYNTDWVKPLNQLTRQNKHNELSAQTRTETHRRRSGEVEWDPSSVAFGGELTIREGGGITIGEGGSIEIGSGGVSIGGEPVDPWTQQTASSEDVIYVDWLFSEIGASVLQTLKTFSDRLPVAIREIRHVAAL